MTEMDSFMTRWPQKHYKSTLINDHRDTFPSKCVTVVKDIIARRRLDVNRETVILYARLYASLSALGCHYPERSLVHLLILGRCGKFVCYDREYDIDFQGGWSEDQRSGGKASGAAACGIAVFAWIVWMQGEIS